MCRICCRSLQPWKACHVFSWFSISSKDQQNRKPHAAAIVSKYSISFCSFPVFMRWFNPCGLSPTRRASSARESPPAVLIIFILSFIFLSVIFIFLYYNSPFSLSTYIFLCILHNLRYQYLYIFCLYFYLFFIDSINIFIYTILNN